VIKKQPQVPQVDPRLTGEKGFLNFLYVAWTQGLGLPEPTPVQYDIADYLTNGPRRACIQAFRGVGKSYITSAFVVWKLLLDPSLNFLVVSASKTRADDFSTFTLRLMHELPFLNHLLPQETGRASKVSFDVGPAPASHSPSVKSCGVFSSALTGSRADYLIADDIESWNNSQTQNMREKLSETIKEYDAIIKPGGKIIFLGTPQTQESVYKNLKDRGFQTRIWPARVPGNREKQGYGESLAPSIAKTSEPEGSPTDPMRFGEMELIERELSYGRSLFALQFQLDQSLSDTDRYPLKINDLIVADLDPELCPEKLVWCNDPEFAWRDLACVGFNGDRYYRPFKTVGDMVPYQGSVLAIDPSGRGADETSYAVVKAYGGQLYVHECGGLRGGYGPEVLESLSAIAAKQKVSMVLVESNLGDGMFSALLTPVLHKIYPCRIEEVRHNIQKEKRICDVLEPVMNSHKLCISRRVIEDDFKSTQDLPADQAIKYQLMYQLSRVTRLRGALRHDDRLDALSMAVQWHVEAMKRDTDRQMADHKAEILDKEIDKFLNGVFGRKNRDGHTWLRR
jgi:hypothetical protein